MENVLLNVLLVTENRDYARLFKRLLKKNENDDGIYNALIMPLLTDECISELKYLDRSNIDVLLLDMIFPEKQSVKVLSTIREQEFDLPVVILTDSVYRLNQQNLFYGKFFRKIISGPLSKGMILFALRYARLRFSLLAENFFINENWLLERAYTNPCEEKKNSNFIIVDNLGIYTVV